nr:hypothetical protein [Tanacetum cinerariifolium]
TEGVVGLTRSFEKMKYVFHISPVRRIVNWNNETAGYNLDGQQLNGPEGYARILPLRDKCKFHHHDPCPVKCGNCKKVSYKARDYWTPTSVTCYGCGEEVHSKRYCPEMENHNGDKEAC